MSKLMTPEVEQQSAAASAAVETRFVYVTFIRTTAEKLWEALTQREFTKQYFFDSEHVTDWKLGSSWHIQDGNGRMTDSGEIIEIDPPRRLELKWQNEFLPEAKAEGYSLATFDLEPKGETIKLTVTHVMQRPDSLLIKMVSGGWPSILASLKSLLETGSALNQTPTCKKA